MNHIKQEIMKNINIYIVLLLLTFGFTNAQQTPAKKQSKTIAITGATAHIGNGELIENSLIIFKDGKLTTVVDATVAKIEISEWRLLMLMENMCIQVL